MAKPFITIIGLGVTGVSIGLALRKEPGDFEIVGHDKNHGADSAARKLNAVHRTEWNLHRSCEGASMVILALPPSEIAETLRLIAEDLAPNALVLVLSSMMQPVVEISSEALPQHASVVIGHPILTGGGLSGEASADALREAVFCLAAAPQTAPGALELASDFVERIGAKPHFMDALEHDGVMAGVEHLPQLLGAVMMAMSVSTSGWRESQQLAGRRFAQTTSIGGNADTIYRVLRDNRANLLRRIDEYQMELARWRELLETEETPGETAQLRTELQRVVAERAAWVERTLSQDWDTALATPSAPESGGGIFRQLFVGNWGRKTPSGD